MTWGGYKMSAFVEREQDLAKPTTEEARIERHNGQIARAEGNVALNDATPNTPFIASNAMAAAQDRAIEQKKSNERNSFLRQITKIRNLIRELDEQRSAMLEKAAEHRARAQEYFEQADELDDALEDMTDGDVTAEDRANAIAKLKEIGVEADGISDAALIILLEQNRDRINGLGRTEDDAAVRAEEEAERLRREAEAARQLEDSMASTFENWAETPREARLDRYRAADDMNDRYDTARRDADVLDDGQQNSITTDVSIAPTTGLLLDGGFGLG